MSDEESRSPESETIKIEPKVDLDRERLELEKQRLKLEIEFREASRKLDTDRLTLEKSKERTARLQLGLPVLVSVLALSFSAFGEYRRAAEARHLQQMQYDLQYNQAVSSYNEGRIELFKRLTEQPANSEQIKSLYAEIFARDSASLKKEQRDMGLQ